MSIPWLVGGVAIGAGLASAAAVAAPGEWLLPAAAGVAAGLAAWAGRRMTTDPAAPEPGLGRELTRVALATDLQRSVFEVSSELVGCLDEDDALVRFGAALRAYWRFGRLALWLWRDGAWTVRGETGFAEAPAPMGSVRLPDDGWPHLCLDLSPAVEGLALLVAEEAIAQPALIDHGPEDRRAVAEVLRGQLALALRRVLLYRTLQDLARHDPLTGCWRRWYGERRLGELLSSGGRTAVALLDVDHFKMINDTHGHAAGDAVLAGLGRALSQGVRPVDLVVRQGGEEFLVLLPGQGMEEARTVIARLLAAVKALDLPGGPVGLSAGIAVAAPGEPAVAVVQRADAACYAAKRGGRGRIVDQDGIPLEPGR